MSAGYDVKGSTHNRQASDRELAKNTYAVLKDFDLVTRGRFLCVRTRSEKERLMSLLTADVAWLQRHGLMNPILTGAQKSPEATKSAQYSS